jgi:hypothetical protein
MRSKEEAHDYRYFPDPDLLPLVLDPDWVKAIEASLPELPDAKKARLMADYGLSPYDAGVLTSDGDVAAFFEEAATGRDAKLVANWTLNDLLGRLGKDGLEIKDSPIPASDIAALVALIEDGTISGKIARTVFEHMWAGEGAPSAIVEKHGLVQITDTGAIEAAVDALIAANPDKAAAVKDKPQAIGWFVGQVMKETGGKANPAAVNEILKAKLGLKCMSPVELVVDDHVQDQAGGDGGEQIVVARPVPVVAAGRRAQAIAAVVVDHIVAASVRRRQVGPATPGVVAGVVARTAVVGGRRRAVGPAIVVVVAVVVAAVPAGAAVPAAVAAIVTTVVAAVPAVVASLATALVTVVPPVVAALVAVVTAIVLRHRVGRHGGDRAGHRDGGGQGQDQTLHQEGLL